MYDVTGDDYSSRHVNKLRTDPFVAPLLGSSVMEVKAFACERWLLVKFCLVIEFALYVGHYLVSSTGDAECSESPVRVPHCGLT